MQKIGKEEVVEALTKAGVVVVGGALIPKIEFISGIVSKLPEFSGISLPLIAYGAAALLAFGLIKR